MSNIVSFQENQLTAAAIRSQVNLVQEVMQAVMKRDTHYGTIPGTPKPTLYKPGAEVLGATFRIAVSYKIEDLSTNDTARYRVAAIGTHQTSNIVMGEGMGECSSGEEKYKWRKAVNAQEFGAAPEDKRRKKYGKTYNVDQVRTEAADLANTVLKMACKRAQVAMILNVTAASDIFTQDIEDLPEELRPNEGAEVEKSGAGKKEALPECTTEKFDQMCVDVVDKDGVIERMGWKSLVSSGTKEAAHLLAMLQTKYVFSEEQIKTVKSWEPSNANA